MAQINFNSIYTAYYRKAFLFTLSYVHNDLVAEDIVSEAIIYLWELSKEREIPSVEAILITYIRSKSLNYLKHIQAQENVFKLCLIRDSVSWKFVYQHWKLVTRRKYYQKNYGQKCTHYWRVCRKKLVLLSSAIAGWKIP